jgi:Eukaryotic aspartyl protease
LHINFNGTSAYVVKASTYLFNMKNSSGFDECLLLIVGNSAAPNKYILGDIFMMNNYIVYDFDNKAIGLNGNTVEVDYRVKEEILGGLPLSLAIFLLVIGVGLLLTAFAVCFIKCKYRKLQQNLARYDEIA